MTTQKISSHRRRQARGVDADPAMPLLYALRSELDCDRAEVRLRQSAVRRLHRAPRRRADALLRHAGQRRGGKDESRRSRGSARRRSPIRCSRPASRSRCRSAATALSGLDHDRGAAFLQENPQADATRRSAKRWRASSAAAARTWRSCARSSARRRRRRREEAAMNIEYLTSRFPQGGGSLVVSCRRSRRGQPSRSSQARRPSRASRALMPERARFVDRRSARRQRHRLLRQDGHGPGRRRGDRADRRRGARRRLRARERRDGRHRLHLQPGRRFRQHRRPARRHDAAQRRGGSAAHAGRACGAKSSACLPTSSRVENGVVMVPGYALQRVSYGELVGGQHFHHKLEWNKQYGNPLDVKVEAKPKDPSQYKIVGKSFRRRSSPRKCMGRAQYVTDVKVRRHAARARDPAAERGLRTGARRRTLDRGHSRRARRAREGFHRGRRRARMGRGARGRDAQSRRGRAPCAPFPAMADAARPHPQGESHRQRRAGQQGRRRRSAQDRGQASSRPNTSGRCSRTRAWARRARSRT